MIGRDHSSSRLYNIYYSLRELAKEKGDPIIGTVRASSKKEAELLASSGKFHLIERNYVVGAELLVVEAVE